VVGKVKLEEKVALLRHIFFERKAAVCSNMDTNVFRYRNKKQMLETK